MTLFRFFSILIVLFFLPFGISAKIWRVNNSVGVSAAFSSLQTACNTANAGDTIYVEGSNYSYADVLIEKKLVVIGPGYLLGKNLETSADTKSAVINSIHIKTGSDGLQISGLEIDKMYLDAGNNILIKRNKIRLFFIYGDSAASKSNITITQNLLDNLSFLNQYGASLDKHIYNLIILNNIIKAYIDLSSVSIEPSVFSQNTCTVNTVTFRNFTLNNNVFDVKDQASYFWNCSLQRNAFFGKEYYVNNTVIASDTLNNRYASSALFPSIGTWNNDSDWKLPIGSKASGYALSGGDCGAFGGVSPYVNSGLPSIPSIVEFLVAPAGNVNNGIQIQFKAKIRP